MCAKRINFDERKQMEVVHRFITPEEQQAAEKASKLKNPGSLRPIAEPLLDDPVNLDMKLTPPETPEYYMELVSSDKAEDEAPLPDDEIIALGPTPRIINTVELLVINEARRAAVFTNICRCEKCFSDICAIALNHLEPRYVSTEEGAMFSRARAMNADYAGEISAAVYSAVDSVKRKPAHD